MDAGEAVTVPESNETEHQVVTLQEEICDVIKNNSTTIEGENSIGVLKEAVNHVTTVVETKQNDKTAIDGVEKLKESCENVEEKDGPDGNIVATIEDAKRVPNNVTTAVEGQEIDKTATDVVDKLEGNSKEVEGVNANNSDAGPTEEKAKYNNSEEVDEVEDMDNDEVEENEEVEEGKHDENSTQIKDKGETVSGDANEEDVNVNSEKKVDEENTILVKRDKESVVVVGSKMDEKLGGNCRKKNENKGTKTGNKPTLKANPKTPESGKKRKVSDKPSPKDEGKQESGRKNENKGTKTGNKPTPKANPKTPESGKKRKVSDKPSPKDEGKQESGKKNVNKGTETGNKPTPKANPKTPESGKKRKVSDKPSPKDEDKQESSPPKRTAAEKIVKAGYDAGPSNKENKPKGKGDAKDGLDPLVKNMVTNQNNITKNDDIYQKIMDEAQDGTGLSENKNVSNGKKKSEDTPGSSKKKNISKGKFVVDEKAGTSSKTKQMGMIFMCSSKTKKDCYSYKVLGLPAGKKDIVQKIYKGMRLFLFDLDLRVMYGIYKAAGPGGFNIEPKAFKSAFPSQVRFKIQHDCEPLGEEKFKKVIKDNYYYKNKFSGELNSEQVNNLCKLFQAKSRKSKSEFARDIKPKRNRVRGNRNQDQDQDRRIRSQLYPDEERRGHAVRPNHHHQHGYDGRSAVYGREVYVSPPPPPVARYPPPPLLAPSSLELDMYRRDRVIEDHGYSRRSDLEIARHESYLPYSRQEVVFPMYHHHLQYSAVNEPRNHRLPLPNPHPPPPARQSYEEEYRGVYRGGGGGAAAVAFPSDDYRHRHHHPVALSSEYGRHRHLYRL
ncbi:DNA ligase 1-like [Impatiens glandulifera]|uniref:DNA ligase 1-like n=1 Tax=Impatiens glandulifera TaxID=253017 RepID=UPI001FB15B9E|nr:DNA ligase 1-like [Impatiens glandulifera]